MSSTDREAPHYVVTSSRLLCYLFPPIPNIFLSNLFSNTMILIHNVCKVFNYAHLSVLFRDKFLVSAESIIAC
jgi:hypothetical protein